MGFKEIRSKRANGSIGEHSETWVAGVRHAERMFARARAPTVCVRPIIHRIIRVHGLDTYRTLNGPGHVRRILIPLNRGNELNATTHDVPILARFLFIPIDQ
jgi:uncharacterized protein (DUF2235 family)